MIHFFFSARTQHENLGDGVISRELIRLAAQQGTVTVYSGGMPAEFLGTIGVQPQDCIHSPYRYGMCMVKEALLWRLGKRTHPPVLLLNPGGFEGGVSYAHVPKHLLLIGAYAFMRLIGIRILRVGCSVGPFTPLRCWLERCKARFAYRRSARDDISLDYVKKHGFAEYMYFPDLAFLMPRPVRVAEASDAERRLVLSFRSEKKRRAYDPAVNAAIQELVGQFGSGARLSFVTQVSFDSERNANLRQLLDPGLANSEILESSSEPTVSAEYARATAVFSNRLHVLLLALRQGVPAYAVIDPAVNSKIAGIYRTVGLEDYIVDISKSDRKLSIPAKSNHFDFIANVFSTQSNLARQLFSTWVH
jgi:polysaccharide pyruvyl transferase WcaK-like protein